MAHTAAHMQHEAEVVPESSEKIHHKNRIFISDKRLFIICFLGIFVSYFVYGVFQENM